MTNGEGWKVKSIWLVIGAVIGGVISLLFSVFYGFVVVPSLTVEQPEIELLTVDQRLFDKGDIVNFTVKLENRGSETASNLLIYAIETTENEGFQSEWVTGYSKILQVGDMTDAAFTMMAPEDNRSEWNIKLYVTTTDGYFWTFDIVYEFLDTHQYHLFSWD